MAKGCRMTELRFIGVEDGCLVVSGDDGRTHRVRIDDALRDAVRPRPAERREAPKVAPRAIQQLIRAGRSVDEVVELTGAEPADVARFEGPIRAERDYLVEQARAVPVRVRADLDPLGDGATFGSALDERLESLGAKEVRWDAWKDPEEGWQLQLAFTVDELEREARWSFEPKSRSLSPRNASATTLSQQGELSSLHAPRLRAVDAPGSDATAVERSTGPDARRGRADGAPQAERTRTAADVSNETADLLEALRRRRGEREPIRIEDELEADYDADSPAPSVPQPHRPPIALAPRARQGDDARAQDSAEDDEPRASAPPRPASATGGIERVRRGSGTTAGGLRFVDVPLEGLDDVDGPEAASADSDLPSDRRRRAAAERAAARAADALTGLAAPEEGAGAAADEELPVDDSPRSDTAAGASPSTVQTGPVGRSRARRSMPSWDEIVFGTKRDD